MIAFLGMGLLGSNFTKALIKKGEKVQVWNRTASRAKALESVGAKAFDNITDAVKDVDVIHIVVKDDAAVNEVLAAAEPGMKPGATIIDHTTTSAEGAVERTKAWKAKGFTYLHAPVFMGPQNALESTGVMLASGDQNVIAKVEPALAKMTGKFINLGPQEGKAAGMKLIGNLFLISLTGGLTDMLSLAKAHDVSFDDVKGLFDNWNPGAMVQARLQRITSGDYTNPSWELNMARKDAGLMMKKASQAGAPLNVIPSVAAEMDKWIEKGFGNSDWTVIASDVVNGKK
ncbi:NAD(P)-dependent oxidoreductase [Pinibacter aurantiacus]|uniref:NAD(P)-dependent oxidoreductase n=1 Tax=Pinibacter aurantiacus TaxID=2851599 RepID=A0A9E2SAD6_9BACT|nr:NAD(P)-dependent oxidoreductase [Pinibacter aurantiacus]MBV4356290.1 NAD(P)-dependent oxidoreductase [Pinibacter aurantiacus]